MKRVLLLLANGYEAFEGAVFTDVFGWANVYGAERIQLISAALRTPIHCTPFGCSVIPERLIADLCIQDFDALAIPGGFETAGFYEDAFSEPFLEVIRQFHAQGKPIASICVGALPIAKSGLLKGFRATTYHLMGGNRRRQLGELGAIVVDEPIVYDNNIITSTSPATAIDVALKLLEITTTPENAAQIKHLMGFTTPYVYPATPK